jgi:hypothetical protein
MGAILQWHTLYLGDALSPILLLSFLMDRGTNPEGCSDDGDTGRL